MSDQFEHVPWPKISRLRRNMIVTEKIDGTNACVIIHPVPAGWKEGDEYPQGVFAFAANTNGIFWVGAQSRERLITPGRDNYGFAAYVEQNADALARTLGPGHHYGEWWGRGIQRNYGLNERRFSLFNTSRWNDEMLRGVPNLYTVPVLAVHTFSDTIINAELDSLREHGSVAAPGFKPAEGVVVYHTMSKTPFKILIENDEKAKGE